MKRAVIAGGAVVALGAATAAGFLIAGGTGEGASADTEVDGGDGGAALAGLSFTPITRQDLVRNEELDGTTGYGDASPLVLVLEGTLTKLPTAGDEISAGDVIAEVNGQPVIAADGAVPLWRELSGGVEDGPDVLQVEQMLATLGYAAEHDVTVDDDWTSATTAAVKAFQEDHGQDDDGVIDLGEIVFIDGTVRVADVGGVVGQASSDAEIEVTSVTPIVSIDLDADDAGLLEAGDAVTVELSDGTEVPATVTDVGEATTDEQGTTTIPVEVSIDDPAVAEALSTGTPVDVLVGVTEAEGVLTVPVEALLAVADGGYALELKDATGTRLVGVDIGTFADGRVEVSGTTEELAEGAEVVIPS
ncbi:peptidoglycan-binding protein [Desertimonas flava]|uniref:peptidoglycan-binding protein n=1 Tax=Desertimonas flava TaxID=2064846 RepID=UPI000E3472D4|nr:peptidoglycan-binding protein [Desertimonas flava]